MSQMSEEVYERERKRVLNDERYPPKLKQWMLNTLLAMYEGRLEEDDEEDS